VRELEPRWRGQGHRLEAWYATFPGAWWHHEVVAPVDGAPYAHGWVAVFPEEGRPEVVRFGPLPPDPPAIEDGRITGEAGSAKWDLVVADDSPPLYTFPRWAWEREVLPGAQIVPMPTAKVHGFIETGTRMEFNGQPAQLARIYGHGNAERWAWLHADLGGGDVLEIVAGVPRRRGLRRLPPAPLVQLRLDGVDWPRQSLAAVPLFRARLGLPEWTVVGTVGRRRLRVHVRVPPDRSVAVAYTDPDGATATCTNSERADAEITLLQRRNGWQPERSWTLEGTAHAEVGTRP
jgi:hypothetical protein